MGWIGNRRQVMFYLSVVRADKDAEGNYLLKGPPNGVSSFMGDPSENADVVIHDEVQYLVGGRACGLAAGLNSTSYGMNVKVF